MKIWSLHPKYLTGRQLKAGWRDGLRALKILSSDTPGGAVYYPELSIFRMQSNPVYAVSLYLRGLAMEASRRGIFFDVARLPDIPEDYRVRIPVNAGQIEYEWRQLIRQLAPKSLLKARLLSAKDRHDLNPLFLRRPTGSVAAWQRLSDSSV